MKNIQIDGIDFELTTNEYMLFIYLYQQYGAIITANKINTDLYQKETPFEDFIKSKLVYLRSIFGETIVNILTNNTYKLTINNLNTAI